MTQYPSLYIEKVKKAYLSSENPLEIRQIPKKSIYKEILFFLVSQVFSDNVIYTEKEVNEKLIPIYPDYCMIRRYLVDYNFLKRSLDGREYWINKDKI
jgi:hypothetical protein